MSAMTILVPADQVGPIRESLLARHGELVEEIERTMGRDATPNGDQRARLEALEAVLAQIGWSSRDDRSACTVTGPRVVLWSAVYDVLCSAAEQLAESCEEYWRGTVDPGEIKTAITDMGVRFDLLESLRDGR